VFTEAGIPLIAPVTTGRELAFPPRKLLFVAFTQYEDLSPPLVDYLAGTEKYKNAKFAAIYQNDIFGKDGVEGLKRRINELETMKYVAGEQFERGATDFSSQVLKCKNTGADVLLLSTAVAQAAMIIKECEKLNWKPQYLVLSGAADEKLIELAGSAAEGLLASTNVIMPTDKNNMVVIGASHIIQKYYPDQTINVPAIDGIAVAMITAEAIRRAGPNPTQEKVVSALENMKNFETGILPPVTFGPEDRQGCDDVFMYQVQNGRFVPIK
jgi:ABC-type branched-subunit amino acid transport system substrate-binding protein